MVEQKIQNGRHQRQSNEFLNKVEAATGKQAAVAQ